VGTWNSSIAENLPARVEHASVTPRPHADQVLVAG